MKNRIRRIAKKISGNTFSDYFNTPGKVFNGRLHFNERIVEKPFIHRAIQSLAPAGRFENLRALEFGHTRSELALELACTGIQVVGVDLRPYGFVHDNFEEHCQDLERFETEQPFDFIYSVSVLEHVGLGAYGEAADPTKIVRILTKLHSLLRDQGRMAITVPYGIAHQDGFLRSFDNPGFQQVLRESRFVVDREEFYVKKNSLFYPADKEEISTISNKPGDRGPTGVNGVGCFLLKAE